MRIAFDIDEVLLDFVNPFLEFHNSKYYTRLRKEEICTFNFSEILGVSREEVDRRFSEFYKTDLFDSIKPVEGAVKGIALLHSKGYWPITVSSRPPEIRTKTNLQIMTHFSEMFHERFFSSHLYMDGNDSSKANICKELNVPVLVEDCLEYAVDAAKKGIDVILFDQPWNQSGKSDGIYRIGSWENEDWWEKAVDYVLSEHLS